MARTPRLPELDEEPRSWRDRFQDEAAAEEAARDLRLSLVGIRQRIWSLWSRSEEEPEGASSTLAGRTDDPANDRAD